MSKTTHAFDCQVRENSERKWVGLTDEEIITRAKSSGVYGTDCLEEVLEFSASIEAKLKEKNT